jgi:hypothetical protein
MKPTFIVRIEVIGDSKQLNNEEVKIPIKTKKDYDDVYDNIKSKYDTTKYNRFDIYLHQYDKP